MYTTDRNVIQQVAELLGWTKEDHNQYVFDCAEAYLCGFIKDYPQVQSQLMKSSIFWKWWRTHWEKRDLEFIDHCYGTDDTRQDRVEIYKEHHDPRTLLTAVYLNGQVLEETYAEMISKVTKSQTQKAVA